MVFQFDNHCACANMRYTNRSATNFITKSCKMDNSFRRAESMASNSSEILASCLPGFYPFLSSTLHFSKL